MRIIAALMLTVLLVDRSAAQQVPRYTIEQFMNTTSLFGASFAPDEASILFTSNATGVFNAYEVPVASGEPRQVTFSEDDAVFAVGFFPQDRRILYLQDRGGDENDHLYVLNEDGSVRDLTPGDSLKAVFYGWADDGTGFFYGTNERDRRYFDIFEVSTATLESQLLFQDTTGWQFGGISPDRRWMALVKPITTNNSDMYLRDTETGEITHLSPHTGDVTYQPADFSKDSQWLYYMTNEGAEFRYLSRRHLESGETQVVEQAKWDITFASVSRTGRYLVLAINNDARTEIRMYTASDHERVPLPEMGTGDLTGLALSPSDDLMAFYVNGDRSPSSLYILDLGTGAPRILAEGRNPEIDATHLVDGKVIRYASYDGVPIPALQFVPHGADADNRVPVILWIHGGPGGQTRLGYSGQRQYMVNHGYAVLAVNNRGSSGYGKTFYAMDDLRHGEADLDDVVWARTYLATQPWADTSKVVILGGSYGGYMTLAGITFRPTAFAAGVDLFGISNWVRTLESIPPWWESFREALYAELGDPATDRERLLRISPLFHADQIERPLMVLQGANDPRVLQIESDEIVRAIRDRGGVVEYLVFEDEGHGFVKRKNRIEAWRAIRAFLDRYVMGMRPSSE